jgi:hypothetical protein
MWFNEWKKKLKELIKRKTTKMKSVSLSKSFSFIHVIISTKNFLQYKWDIWNDEENKKIHSSIYIIFYYKTQFSIVMYCYIYKYDYDDYNTTIVDVVVFVWNSWYVTQKLHHII